MHLLEGDREHLDLHLPPGLLPDFGPGRRKLSDPERRCRHRSADAREPKGCGRIPPSPGVAPRHGGDSRGDAGAVRRGRDAPGERGTVPGAPGAVVRGDLHVRSGDAPGPRSEPSVPRDHGLRPRHGRYPDSGGPHRPRRLEHRGERLRRRPRERVLRGRADLSEAGRVGGARRGLCVARDLGGGAGGPREHPGRERGARVRGRPRGALAPPSAHPRRDVRRDPRPRFGRTDDLREQGSRGAPRVERRRAPRGVFPPMLAPHEARWDAPPGRRVPDPRAR